ncbi:MAG: RNA 2',3'-cyclic phosphodiesterase [Candidatus Lokiarchaeota archaeon]|nr:RNA 2',3'-cyclic phosphodiesterase [Candidatus Lokiarchaeota archaeon]
MIMIRTFIAIELNNENSLELISSVTDRLKKNQKKLKVVEPKNLHLTVKFLGNVAESEAPLIYQVVERVNEKVFNKKSVQFHLKGIGQFNKYSVIWVKLLGDVKFLQDIKKNLEDALYNELKTPKDTRASFKPHLTIARLKKDKIDYKNLNAFKNLLEEYKETEFGVITMSKMALKKSELTPQGPIYTDLVF